MIGTNTMQIDRVATNAGVATSAAPSRMACRRGLPRSSWRWLFSISTVASSTRMPTASAIPPSVITLRDWFRILSMMMEVRIDRGIDVMTIRVLRQDPRNSRIMSAVRQPAIAPSRTTPATAARTKTLWGQNLGHQLP